MGTKSTKWMKLTMGAAAAGLSILSLLPAPDAPMTEDGAARALVLNRADDAWTRRAVELTNEDPAFAARLAQLAESDQVDGIGRGHVLDALARAGTPAAQQAMRAALTAPAVAQDGAYAILVARFASVQSPTAATLAWLGQTHVDAVAAGQTQLALASESALDSALDHRLAMLSRHARHRRPGR